MGGLVVMADLQSSWLIDFVLQDQVTRRLAVKQQGALGLVLAYWWSEPGSKRSWGCCQQTCG